MGSDHRAVDNQILHVWLIGKVLQHLFPNAVVTPAGKPLVDAVPLAVLLWEQAPLRAAAVYPEHGFQEAAALGFVADIDARIIAQERKYL